MSFKTVTRFDLQKMDKAELTEQGYLFVPANLTRVGVFVYHRQDGSVVREFRPPEEVFKPESLKTLQLVPVTDDHPAGLLNASNTKRHIIGTTSETVEQDGNFVKAMVKIIDEDAIDKAKKGKVQLSCGYLADLEETSGEYNGEKYDCIQRNIKYNHVSLVKKGRAGPQVRLRMDSNDAELVNEEDSNMEKITINGQEFSVEPAVATAYKAQVQMFDSEKKKLEDEYEAKKASMKSAEELEKAEKLAKENGEKADTLQAKVDSLTEELKKKTDSLPEDKINERVQKRLKILDTARFVLGSEAKLDEKSDLDLMKEVIKKDSPATDLENKSEVYVEARFDHISEQSQKDMEARKSFASTLVRKDTREVPDSKEARKKMMEEAKNLHKTKE